MCGIGSVASVALDAQHCGSYPETSGSRWYCAKTHTRAEFDALWNLGNQKFRAHIPLFVQRREKVAAPRAGAFSDLVTGKLDDYRDVIRPLFPGYLFVRFDMALQGWRAVASTIGIAHLFSGSNERPIPVTLGIVETLIAKGRPWDGVIDENYGGPEMPGVALGERVRITSGPFRDLTGICTMSGAKRIGLLLEAMGGTSVEVDRNNVVAA